MTVDPLVSMSSSIQSGPGVFAFLLGSGVSKSAGVPTGWEVTGIMAQRIANAEGADTGGDPVGWYQERFGDDPAYSDLVAQLARSTGDRVTLLKGLFEPPEDDEETGTKRYSQAHSAVAGLAAKGYVRVIVTTNFDRLLEQALSELGVQPAVITDAASAGDAMPLAHSPVTIIKVNGDYLSANFKNTIEELDGYRRAGPQAAAPSVHAIRPRGMRMVRRPRHRPLPGHGRGRAAQVLHILAPQRRNPPPTRTPRNS